MFAIIRKEEENVEVHRLRKNAKRHAICVLLKVRL